VDAHLVDEASAQHLAADARAERVDVISPSKPDGDLGGIAWAADEDVSEGLPRHVTQVPLRARSPRRGTGRVLRDITSAIWPATALSAAAVPVEVHM
jgi:hypothetical protein